MRQSPRGTFIKITAFATVMTALTVFLFFIFGQYQTGPVNKYSAVFADASELKAGESVRVAGIRVGTVDSVHLRPDNKIVVEFDADRKVVLTAATKAAVRYLNLVGDRYLELINAPGSTRIQPSGTQIPLERTMPALDLDLLLGGLKPVTRGLNPRDVNALTNELIQIFQGEGQTVKSLLAHVATFSNTLAGNGRTVQQLIENLRTVVGTIAKDGKRFSAAIDQLERLITGLAQDRDTIGSAIDSLSRGSASLADLLTNARRPLAGTVEQLSRVAPLLDKDKDLLDIQLQELPEDYHKLIRTGAYGSFINYYLCGLSVRVSDLQGRTAVFPWIKQEGGRCAER
ncbi:MCE family protein [Mycobacterium paraintracellulare]|uniref:MCE family protein n=1 Tax=Mycobacterium paraintracellulare TaxID=1138383 RepID=UPI0019282E24|nr:MCE family protein [Mycobacterium paraintracellulare]BCP14269.1 mammalian cell entry protein [Mycobacterium paraintracellulare]